MCDVTRWDEWRDSFVCVRWLDLKWGGLEIVMLDVCVTWLVETCDVIRWDMWRVSLRCVTWLLNMCEVNRLICATWLVVVRDVTWPHVWGIAGCLCDVTRWDVWRDSGLVEMCMQEICDTTEIYYATLVSLICDKSCPPTYERVWKKYVTSHHVLHMKETCDVTLVSLICDESCPPIYERVWKKHVIWERHVTWLLSRWYATSHVLLHMKEYERNMW